MDRKKRYIPRYQSTLAGLWLLIAERRLREKTGRNLASPLGFIGRRLLMHRIWARSPMGLAIRMGTHLTRKRFEQLVKGRHQ